MFLIYEFVLGEKTTAAAVAATKRRSAILLARAILLAPTVYSSLCMQIGRVCVCADFSHKKAIFAQDLRRILHDFLRPPTRPFSFTLHKKTLSPGHLVIFYLP